MSHISKIELEIRDLRDLKEACRMLGFEFMENQKTYEWYGSWVGDTPMPDGIRQEDLGKCDHTIRIDGCKYEIGVVRNGDQYTLLWDYWQSGGLQKRIGVNGGTLKQAYTLARVRNEARRKGYSVLERKTETGVRVHIRM